MFGSADGRHRDVDEYGPRDWSSSTGATCCEPGCVLSTPTNTTDQFSTTDDHSGEDATTMSTFWFGQVLNNDNALYRGSYDFADRHIYDQRQETMPIHAVAAHPLPTPVLPPQPAGTCSNFTQLGQHNYDRFPSNNCEYHNLQPVQQRPGYSWGNGFVGMVQRTPLNQCVGLSGCTPSSACGPGSKVAYSSPTWVHVKSERRRSSSATSSGVDCPTTGFAANLVQMSPSYCNSRPLKQETFAPGLVESAYNNEFAISADVDKDDWTGGRCLSDTSPSSVEQFSDAVRYRALCSLLQRNHSCLLQKLSKVPRPFRLK